MGQLTLVLGGVRSGKSKFAEKLAAQYDRVIYVATATAGDEEMRRRINEHRRRRPENWRTVECPWDLPAAINEHGRRGCLLVECLNLWLTNLLVGIPGKEALGDLELSDRIEDLVQTATAAEGRLILVSNEVGLGGVQPNLLARRFADWLGQMNQRLAEIADEVHLCVAGLTLRLK